MSNKINIDLKDLLSLKNSEQKNPQVRALSYLLYENNGVVKRENVSEILKKLEQNDRKILRNMGIKFGRYHIFLYKLFKPSVVSLRIALWKNYHQKYFQLKPHQFGLNFVESKKYENKSKVINIDAFKIKNSTFKKDQKFQIISALPLITADNLL